MGKLEEIRKRKIKELMEKIERMRKEKKMKEEKLKIEVGEENFKKEVIEKSKEKGVVVDFWAEWCMPCLMLAPILEKLVKEYKGKFILAKVNVDREPRLSQEYGVMSIPNVKFFKNGRVVDEFVGVIPEHAVKEWLDKNLR